MMCNTRVTRVQTDRPPRLSHLMQSKSPELDFPSSAPEAPSGRKKAQLFHRPPLLPEEDTDEFLNTKEASQSNLTAVAEASSEPWPTRFARRNSTLPKIVERPREYEFPSSEDDDESSSKRSISHFSESETFTGQVTIHVGTPGGTRAENVQEERGYPRLEDDDEYVSRRRSSTWSRRSSSCSVFETFSGRVRMFVKTPDGLLQVYANLNWTPEILALSLGISMLDWMFCFRGKSLAEGSPLKDMHGLELGSVVHATPARLLRARTPLVGRRRCNWRTRKYCKKEQPLDIKSGAIVAKLGA